QRRTQELEALLRISEELNQSLEVDDLLDLVLFLMLDLLPGNLGVIHRIDENGEVIAQRTQNIRTSNKVRPNEIEKMVGMVLQLQNPVIWPGDEPLSDQFGSGMAVLLK